MSRLQIVVLAIAFLFIVLFAFTGSLYSRLPETIPTHWNYKGEPDAFGSRASVWIMPVLSIPLAALFLGLAMSVGKTEKERFSLAVMGLATQAFFFMMQVVIVFSSLGYRIDMSRYVGVCIGLLFAAIGYAMKDLPRNNLAGIRLPWTMASDEAWEVSHRRSSRIIVVGGLLGAAAAAIGGGIPGVVVSLGGMIYAIFDSYFATRPARLASIRPVDKK